MAGVSVFIVKGTGEMGLQKKEKRQLIPCVLFLGYNITDLVYLCMYPIATFKRWERVGG